MVSPESLPAPKGLVAGLGNRLLYGADYNPEQWPEEVWLDDVRLMRAAGVNFVSVGIFSWALLEPRDGEFEFGWLDRILDLLADNGIYADLATATAAVPAWLTIAHPEIQPVNELGQRLSQGGRQNWCASSPIYREKSLRLVRTIAERYAAHPALAMWHVSNELGCHNARCYCDVSAGAFRRWLERRYGDVAALNHAWGTAFWSQRYGNFDEILPPRLAPTFRNPTQRLDFARFSSEELLDYFRAERDILKAATPHIPVTTNFMAAGFNGLDYWAWSRELDVVSNDHYLRHSEAPVPAIQLSMSADLSRGLADGRPWLLMEHSTSAVNWQQINIAKQPGEMTRNTLAHVARGADGACFFQWRASVAGSEKFHSAMVPHAGTDTDVWREVEQLGANLSALTDLAGSVVRSDVAILIDYHAWWATDLDAHPSADLRYLDAATDYYGAFWEMGIGVDFPRPGSDLSAYRLVVVPTLYSADDVVFTSIHEYVANGGTALVTYFSGISDANDHIIDGGYPGAFRDMLGVRVEQFFPLARGERVTLSDGSTASLWSEHLHAVGAEVVATYADGSLPGVPAITRNTAGSGVAWYAATRLDPPGTVALLRRITAEAGVVPTVRAPAGVEVVRRVHEDGTSWLFVINHTAAAASVDVDGVDVLTGRHLGRTAEIAAGSVAVIRMSPGG